MAAGYQALDFMPTQHMDGRDFKFMGVYAKNREEWAMSDLATIRQNGTTVAFYDTLGPAAVEFVIKQTGLSTISCAGSYLRSWIMLKV